jgi:hypothetical protein
MSVDFLESLRDAIKATVSEELRDGKGNRYPFVDYDTFLTNAAAAINDYKHLKPNSGLTFFVLPVYLSDLDAPKLSLDSESFFERIYAETCSEEGESLQSEEPHLRDFFTIFREASRTERKADLQLIIKYLTKREKTKLHSCLKTLSSLRQAYQARIPRMRHFDLVDQLTFLMKRHVPKNTPKSTIAETVSQLLASHGFEIRPISIYQRERRKKS